MPTLRFSRTTTDTITKDLRDYHAGAGLTLPPRHAPEAEQSVLEGVRATMTAEDEVKTGLRKSVEGADRMARAMGMLDGATGLRELFEEHAQEEARLIEAHLSAGRPPEPEPAVEDDDRLARARAALERSRP